VIASLVFLTPGAGFVAVAGLGPLAGLALAGRRVRRVRTTLGLPAPPPSRLLPRVIALAAVPVFLGMAAAQPALRSRVTARVRTDAQAMFVLDNSRSMLAAKGPTAATRLARAKRAAIVIRAALPEVPAGVATFTDRVLPALLPTADPSVFAAVVDRAVSINQPPPADSNVVATDLGGLSLLATGDYFAPSVRRRLVVVLTDGESRQFDTQKLARALKSGPGVKLVLVHVSATGEAVYDGTQLEQGYHEDPASGAGLASLASATGGVAVGEHDLARAISAAKADVGSGPTITSGRSEHDRTLAPFVALLALLPLLLLARRESWRRIGAALRSVGRVGDSAAAARPYRRVAAPVELEEVPRIRQRG
jgi:hypothetical protein